MSNIELSWKLDDRFMSQMSAYMDRLKELGVIANIPDRAKLVVHDFVGGIKT
jgi:hypothetical protein